MPSASDKVALTDSTETVIMFYRLYPWQFQFFGVNKTCFGQHKFQVNQCIKQTLKPTGAGMVRKTNHAHL